MGLPLVSQEILTGVGMNVWNISENRYFVWHVPTIPAVMEFELLRKRLAVLPLSRISWLVYVVSLFSGASYFRYLATFGWDGTTGLEIQHQPLAHGDTTVHISRVCEFLFALKTSPLALQIGNWALSFKLHGNCALLTATGLHMRHFSYWKSCGARISIFPLGQEWLWKEMI